jgi:prephenate dehydrogenase
LVPADLNGSRKRSDNHRPMHFNKITILGVGFMGASFALAVRQKRLCSRITGWGRSQENLRRAVRNGIIDDFEADAAVASKDSDLVILATPVGIFADIMKYIGRSLKQGAVVTDMGSVKGRLVYEMEALTPEGSFFIGSHPIAGSDRSGIDTAFPGLFEGARCIVTPTNTSDSAILARVIDLWERLGSRVAVRNPDEHDRICAAVSHLPHLLAYELVNTIADIELSYLDFAGNGFKDTTRIASSRAELWRDICLLNKENVVRYLDMLRKRLDQVREYLIRDDAEMLMKEFERASGLRQELGQDRD